jgi:hypothetical protein
MSNDTRPPTLPEIARIRGRPFQKGQSGNPAGRKKGARSATEQIRAAVGSDNLKAILLAQIEKAKAGDTAAARVVFEVSVPRWKPVEPMILLDLPENATLAEQGEAIVAAVAAGELSPSTGAQLLQALGAQAKVVEVDDLARRIEALEASQRNNAAVRRITA